MVWEVGRVEEFAQEFVGRVLDHLHLFYDDLLLALQIFAVKARVSKHVCQNVEGLRESLVRDLHREACDFVRSEGVKVSAQTVAFDCYIKCASSLCAFENRVLYEMADAVKLRLFVARAATRPDTYGHGAQTRHLFGQNCQTIVETGGLNLIYHKLLEKFDLGWKVYSLRENRNTPENRAANESGDEGGSVRDEVKQ